MEMLTVEGLTLDFVSIDGRVRILNDVSLNVRKGEVVGIVGESGSGKSTLAQTILRLLETPPTDIVRGKILFEGTDILKVPQSQMPMIRGTGVSLVFQDPLDSLNPVHSVESQLRESIRVRNERLGYQQKDPSDEKNLMLETLGKLCIDTPELVLKKYPHELSGGMRQRVAIAMSIIETPKLLILDEPTTGLDVYVQNRILKILKDLNQMIGTTLIYITHDLTVASQVCDRLYIMYAGRMVESGSTSDVLSKPLHPYTSTLIASVPQGFEDSPPLPVPHGESPNLRNLPRGCKFNPRCPFVDVICKREEPPLVEAEKNRHTVSCWIHDKSNGGKYHRS